MERIEKIWREGGGEEGMMRMLLKEQRQMISEADLQIRTPAKGL